MLNELNEQQLAALPVVRDQWLAYGLFTAPADRAEAEEGVADAYRARGLKPPGLVIWRGSPLTGAISAALLSSAGNPVQKEVWGEVGEQVWGEVHDEVRGEVREQVWGEVGFRGGIEARKQVRGEVGDLVQDEVWGDVGFPVQDEVWGDVGNPVGEQVWGEVGFRAGNEARKQVQNQVNRGQHEAGWIAYYEYFRTACGVAGLDCISGRVRVARSAGWWWPFENAVILTERPSKLHRDGQGRLHCEDGPAFLYPDGFAGWFWHGVRVPQDLVEGGWGVERILSERNVEIRRCAVERLGWDAFIRESGLKKVACAPDPGNSSHRLALYELPDALRALYDDDARILLCVNGSPEPDGEYKKFGLPVPARHTDPIEAAAELYGWPVEAYRRLEVRR